MGLLVGLDIQLEVVWKRAAASTREAALRCRRGFNSCEKLLSTTFYFAFSLKTNAFTTLTNA